MKTNFKPKKTLVITNIDQARLLANKTKLQIIQELKDIPRTTMQVADILGEKPTKLYRHVEALRDAGLITLVEEKPKRGTVEKYFLAVAQRFEIHPDIFSPDDQANGDLLHELLRDTNDGIRNAIYAMQADQQQVEDMQPCLQKFTFRASEKQIKKFRQQLLEIMEQAESLSADSESENTAQWSGVIAFYSEAID